MPCVGIRVDAKSNINGMYNVVRCISLAIELSKRFYDVYFFTKFDCSYEKIKDEGFNVFKIADSSDKQKGKLSVDEETRGEDIALVKSLFVKHNVTDLIIDLPFVVEGYYRNYVPLVKRIIQIEDNHNARCPANVIVNGSLYSKNIEYPIIQGQTLLLGTEYCLIDHAVSQFKERKQPKAIKEIFIYVDPNGKTNSTCDILKTLILNEDIKLRRLNTFVDESFKDIDELETLAKSHSNIIIHREHDKLLDLISESHIGITNDLFSIYRLLACGVPTLSFLDPERELGYGDNINEIIETIWEQKYIGLANEANRIFQSIVTKAQRLIESETLRLTLSEKGKKTIDGYGAKRLAGALQEIMR